MNRNTFYWLATGSFCAVQGFSGVAHLARVESMVESMAALGYPVFVMSALGTAKLLGVTALLAPGLPLMEEWAYAGFAFDPLGATATHVFVGDPLAETAPPAFLLLVGVASYLLRPPSRRIPMAPIGADASPATAGTSR